MDTPYAQPTKETKQLPALLLTRPEAEAALASVKQVEASAVASEAAMKGGGE